MSFVPSMTVTGQQVCRIGSSFPRSVYCCYKVSVQDVFTILDNLKKEGLCKQVRSNEMGTVSLEKTNRITLTLINEIELSHFFTTKTYATLSSSITKTRFPFSHILLWVVAS
ncbi:uncharacterized protein L203_105608 [Cryptococcus depauperatus CBS 7841]|uniref:Uncharacterized protein n=1 Tax=Cryptococcus depauperatus CBS 7841 TaxID=1295531 RepID=A0AAJ8JXU5_9TREE